MACRASLSTTILCTCALSAAPNPVSTSTIDDQMSVEVTVYNSNLGLVKDVRKLSLAGGEAELRFMGVAAQIMPVTVRAQSLNHPDDFAVLEQNYEYDLMSAEKLLDKYIGKKIKIIDVNEFKDKRQEIEAVLLSNNEGQIFKINNEIYLGHPGYRIVPEIPENLIANPTLMWLYRSRRRASHELEVSYLTGSITWKADYVVVLHKDDSKADLSGWVTVDNTSGATYRDAALKLVAGKVHRVQERRIEPESFSLRRMKSSAAAPAFTEQEFFEYHIYDLERPTTIKDRQTKQISLLEANGFAVTKELLVYGARSYYIRRYHEKVPQQPVAVYIKFKNSAKNMLGMPLPEGIVRVYKRDHEQSQQFVGEDRIEHTPKDEEVRLKLGEAFDVVAERTQTDYEKVTSSIHETEWEISLRNHKKVPVTVGLIEPVHGEWKVVENSHDYTKVDAFTVRFDVRVPADKEVKVTYRLRVKY